jgi:broad-specificity NMP kinase
MKTLYFIGGTMGIGKTTISQALKRSLNRSVFLDGDWCWDMHPFTVTLETKRLVQLNIVTLLNNFLQSPAFDYVIFCWVMHQQEIIDNLLKQIDTSNCRLINLSLVSNAENLRERLQKDIDTGLRQNDILERSIARLPFYENLDSHKIDVSGKSIEQIVSEILELSTCG